MSSLGINNIFEINRYIAKNCSIINATSNQFFLNEYNIALNVFIFIYELIKPIKNDKKGTDPAKING